MSKLNNSQKNKIQISVWRCCKESDLFYERM